MRWILCKSLGISADGRIEVMGKHETDEKDSFAIASVDTEMVGHITGCMLG